MSITSALYTATSGLMAQSTALASISSNISNSSTTGFKDTGTTFTSFINKTASMDVQTGGVRAQNYRNISQQGEIQSASKTTNLAINGARLWDSLMELAAIGATAKGGVCRLTLTDLDKRARDLFASWCKAAGATITNFPTYTTPGLLGDTSTYPDGQPVYYGDPDVAQPIEALQQFGKAPGMGGSNMRIGGQQFNTFAQYRLRVAGRTADGALSKLEVVALNPIVSGH